MKSNSNETKANSYLGQSIVKIWRIDKSAAAAAAAECPSLTAHIKHNQFAINFILPHNIPI